MRLGIINDLHISLDGDDSYGVDTRRNALDILSAIRSADIDRLCILGDVCLREPQLKIYEWLQPKVENLDVPVFFVPGNHDDVGMIKQIAGKKNTASPYSRQEFDGYTALSLDSSSGVLSNEQLAWVQHEVSQDYEKPILFFVHHPPLPIDVPYMDNAHGLKDGGELFRILSACSSQILLFCGHYHVDKVVMQEDVTIFVTPSSYMQIDQDSAGFKVDHYRIGYRIMDILPECIRTRVHYLDGHLLRSGHHERPK